MAVPQPPRTAAFCTHLRWKRAGVTEMGLFWDLMTSARPYLFDLILHARMTQLFVFVSTFITTVVPMYLLH